MDKTVSIRFSDAQWKALLAEFPDPALAIRAFWHGRADREITALANAARISEGVTGTDEEIVLTAVVPTAVERAAADNLERDPVPS